MGAVSSDSVTKAIRKELETYDADKTGKTDYALETSGLPDHSTYAVLQ